MEKKFIITDPCYIMDNAQYEDICNRGCDFESEPMPLESKHRDTGERIVFHLIEGTPNGDGSLIYRGQYIGVDAGLLCIAEGDWSKERFGATFTTLEKAQSAFPNIIKEF